MKMKITLPVAGFVAAAFACHIAIEDIKATRPSETDAPAITRLERKTKPLPEVAIATQVDGIVLSEEATYQSEADLAAGINGWKDRFNTLLTEHGDRDAAIEALLTELDTIFTNWVEKEIEVISELPPLDRYDKLDVMGQSLREGAAEVLEELEIPGSRHHALVATAMNKLTAETEYAEAAPDHASRLAMLHIDRERQGRMNEVVTIKDETARAQAMSELDAWYDNSLAKVFPENAEDNEMN
jgi:hypothetical protein